MEQLFLILCFPTIKVKNQSLDILISFPSLTNQCKDWHMILCTRPRPHMNDPAAWARDSFSFTDGLLLFPTTTVIFIIYWFSCSWTEKCLLSSLLLPYIIKHLVSHKQETFMEALGITNILSY